jgi:hypothetical protein
MLNIKDLLRSQHSRSATRSYLTLRTDGVFCHQGRDTEIAQNI